MPDKPPEEEWREIFDGLFAVSSLGQIKRIRAPYGRARLGLRIGDITGGGYRRVLLSIDGKAKHYTLHRLIMLAFVGPCPEGKEVAHLNGISTDCRLENLAYVTPSENSYQKVAHGTMPAGEKCHTHKLKEAEVLEIRRRLAAGEGLTALSREYGVGLTAISQIRERRSWKHI